MLGLGWLLYLYLGYPAKEFSDQYLVCGSPFNVVIKLLQAVEFEKHNVFYYFFKWDAALDGFYTYLGYTEKVEAFEFESYNVPDYLVKWDAELGPWMIVIPI